MIDNEHRYQFERESLQVSPRFKRLLALRIVELCVKQFASGAPPPNASAIAQRLQTPVRLARESLFSLVQSGVLAAVKCNGADESYQPAQNPERLTIKYVIDALERRSEDDSHLIHGGELEKLSATLEQCDRLIASSPHNAALKRL